MLNPKSLHILDISNMPIRDTMLPIYKSYNACKLVELAYLILYRDSYVLP